MVELFVTIVIIGLVTYACTLIPGLPDPFVKLIIVVGVLIAVLVVVRAFGISIPVPKLQQ